MIKLGDYEEIQQAYMLYLGENNLIKEAVFVGCSVDGENGFLLKVVYESEGKNYQGILYKKRGGVKLFHTPVVIFRTASLFSISYYSVDQSSWNGNFYDPYDAQVISNQKRKIAAL